MSRMKVGIRNSETVQCDSASSRIQMSRNVTRKTYATDGKGPKQLLSILHLLRYAEAEVSELGLETSAVLLEAAIADLAQNLR